MKILKGRQDDFYRRSWYFTRSGFLPLRGTEKNLGGVILSKSHRQHTPLTSYCPKAAGWLFLPFPSLLCYFPFSILKTTVCPQCCQWQLWCCPQHSASKRCTLAQATTRGCCEGRRWRLFSKAGRAEETTCRESHCSWQKEHLNALQITNCSNSEKWMQAELTFRKNLVLVLRFKICVPWGQQQIWGKLSDGRKIHLLPLSLSLAFPIASVSPFLLWFICLLFQCTPSQYCPVSQVYNIQCFITEWSATIWWFHEVAASSSF